MSWTIDRSAVFDTRVRAPRYERIASAIEAALERGELRPGDRLPTVRALARDLEVSSASVAVAYSILERRGRLHARVGRGTFVTERATRAAAGGTDTPRIDPPPGTPSLIDRPTSTPSPVARVYTPTWRRRVLQFDDRLRALSPDALMCSASWPDPGLLPIDVLRRAYTQAVQDMRPADLQYGGPEAHPDLANALSAWLDADGVPADPANLLVLSSFGQLLSILLQLAPSLGGTQRLTVAVEEPGYHAAFNLIEHRGHHLLGMATDDHGVRPETLRAALATGAHVALLTPRALNPTGASWSVARREALAEVLLEFPHVLVVEDDHFAGVAEARPGSLAGDARLRERVIYARSHSKSIAPDLRLTVIVARGRLFALLRDARLSDGGWAPRIGQRALALALADPALAAALLRARAAYAERRQAAAAAVVDALPSSEVCAAADGLNIWVRLPVDAQDVVQQASHAGVLVASGEPFYLRPGRRDAVRISVGRVDTPGARRVGDVLGRAALTVDEVPFSLAH